MSLVSVDAGSIVSSVGNIIDDVFTSEEEKLEYKLKEKKIENEINLAQIEVNKEEAKVKTLWRPMIGYVGAMALFYKFIGYPLLVWIWYLLQAYDLIEKTLPVPPIIDASELYPIILGMLGFGGYRTFEKTKKIN